ncbi:TIM barrel protein [Companilactobacillus allii]|uniref:Sugar phosphate isomerase n=1 Tax=Companilactobacillus allii TaxID=1847728 RepID=A0A1P8Q1P4_9LACO|nr:TIM barrel protein [Companilactobacillus allii]APX71802.1 sugar phosphate isomerase [Companilactobacillus allii]USQ68889.1 TIM barrel protein [Companilactobacillus allii]
MSLILNTLIFAKDVENGTSQVSLLECASKLGAYGVEVRREYFKDIKNELSDVARRANEDGLKLYYSVPDVIFEEDGSLNPKITQYFSEGETMGIKKIKFNIGHFDRFTGNLKKVLGELPIDKIEMNVENDQTQISGSVSSLLTFLKAVKENNIDIGYVYDLGNWAFTEQDAVDSAKALATYTRYIHLKNIVSSNGSLSTSADLNNGIFDWKKVLTYLPNNVDLALEYPIDTDEQIKSQMNIVKTLEES